MASISDFMPSESLADLPDFIIYMIIMTTLAQLLLLTLVLVLAYKMNRLVAKLDQISQNAGKFVQMGMTFFKKH